MKDRVRELEWERGQKRGRGVGREGDRVREGQGERGMGD